MITMDLRVPFALFASIVIFVNGRRRVQRPLLDVVVAARGLAMRVRAIGPSVFAVMSSIGLLAQDQSDLPRFRAGVELIQLDVAVLDDKRQPVRGLAASDFTVLENGVERPIRAFAPIELAARTRSTEAVWATEIAPDVATNRVSEQDGRLVVILMDRSIPVQEPTLVARRIAAAAIDALGPNDLAAVVSTNNGAVQTSTVQNFTADRARLLQAISADPSTGISTEAEEIWERVGLKFDPLSDGRCLCGLCVLETMTRVADALEATPRRRKALLFIGSNVIWQSNRLASERGADTGCETPLKDARTALLAAVDRANLTVHSIDPQGLLNVGPQTRGSSLNGLDRPNKSATTLRLEKQQQEMSDLLSSQQNIRLLPDRTGGRTVINRNNPEETVPEIYRESEAYYLLAVERGPADSDTRPRSIEVKVGRKGVRAYTQRQYVPPAPPQGGILAAPAPASASSADALARLLPSATLPLSLAVTALASPDSANAVLRLNVDAGAFARGAATAVPLDVTVMAVDRTGRPVASARQRSTISADRLAAGDPVEVNVPSHLELPPGDYGIRAAISDSATGRVASVFSDVTVPRFDSDPLSLSSVAVDVANSPTAEPAPTTRRTFRRGERVRALLQIYQGTQRTEPIVPVSMRVQILDAKGTAVRDQSLPFTENTFVNRRADCLITLPLANLPAGEYLLKLEASSNRQRTGRALRFEVQ
jgi:VWFA-related protein